MLLAIVDRFFPTRSASSSCRIPACSEKEQVCFRFLDGIEIFPLDILYERNFEPLHITEFFLR
jgi:hypothetical protein